MRRYWPACAALAVILIATLFPFPGSAIAEVPLTDCFVCGERGVADVIANIILFMPFGAALAWRGERTWRIVLAGALLTISIEFLQQLIPGRDPSLSDLVFNTVGTAAGIPFWHAATRWRDGVLRGIDWLAVAATAVALALLGAGAFLLTPSLGAKGYTVEWTPDIPGMEQFRGEVISANVGSAPLSPGIIPHPARLRNRLERGAPVRVVLTRDRRTSELAPILRLRDLTGEQVLLIAADGDAVVAQIRTRAASLRLDQPDLRVSKALGAPGAERTQIRFWQQGRNYCIEAASNSDCSLGFTLGDTWGIVLYPGSPDSDTRSMAALLWLALLMLPAGLAARHPATLVLLGLTVAATLLMLPRLAGIAPTPPLQIAAALAGLLIGWVIAGVLRYRNKRCIVAGGESR